MTERGILFTAPMVRAILEGRKTVTRRPVKPQPVDGDGIHWNSHRSVFECGRLRDSENAWRDIRCPFGVPGDRLYVKEATWIWCEKRPNGTTKGGRPKFRYVPSKVYGRHAVFYCADRDRKPAPDDPANNLFWKYKPARFMPRWASRITLEVTDVHPERVQDITEEEAIREGLGVQIGDGTGPGPGFKWNGPGYFDHVSRDKHGDPTFHVATGRNGEFCSCRDGGRMRLTPARCAYRILWNATYPGSWERNDWCWCVLFRRLA